MPTFDTSAFAAVRVEDPDAIHHIKSELVAAYQPANSEELFAIERLALARHSLLRCYRIEAGLITSGLDAALGDNGEIPTPYDETVGESKLNEPQNHSLWMTLGFRKLCRTDVIKLFLRYQAQTDRLYRNALEALRRVLALRDKIAAPTLDPDPPASAQPEPPQPSQSPQSTQPAKPTPVPSKPAAPPPTTLRQPIPAAQSTRAQPPPASAPRKSTG